MKEEFNLSEQLFERQDDLFFQGKLIREIYIKKFIKLLKEEFDREINVEFKEEGSNMAFRANMVFNKIKDKLAGNELI